MQMVELNDILHWKQEFGELYQMQIHDQHFIFRPLGREEYKHIVIMDLDLGDFQEAICFQAMIYPSDYDYAKGIAGIAEVMSDAILDASGLHMGQAKILLDDFRAEMWNYDYQVDCMIHEAFPEYTLEEIATWPIRKTMYYLSRAEWILQTLKGVPLQMIDESIQEELQMQEQGQQPPQPQQPPEPPQPQAPPQRPIRKELIEAPEIKEQPKPQQQQAPEGGIQSEEELLAMLTGAGAKVSKPITDLDKEQKPELNWFGYMDELTGEFD
jgi:hypothetical protein